MSGRRAIVPGRRHRALFPLDGTLRFAPILIRLQGVAGGTLAVPGVIPFPGGLLRVLDLALHAEEQVQVGIGHVLGRAFLVHHATFQQDGAVTVTGDLLGGMGDEQDGGAARDQLLETAEALGLELGVPHGQSLVDDQHVRLDAGRDGKGQPHVHAGRVRLDGPVDELANVGEGFDVGKAPGDFLSADAQDGAIEIDVLTSGELGVEARAQLQQRGHATTDGDLASSGRERAAQDLQQRALAGAVAADDTDGLTPAHGEVQPLQRPELAEVLRWGAPHQTGQTAHQQLLEQVARAVVELEALGQARDADGHVAVQRGLDRRGGGLAGKDRISHISGMASGRRALTGWGTGIRGHRRTPCGCSGTRQSPARQRAPCRR